MAQCEVDIGCSLPAPMHGLRISNGLICNVGWRAKSHYAYAAECRRESEGSQGKALAGYWLTDLAIFSGSASYIYRVFGLAPSRALLGRLSRTSRR